jgi:hypothetical protein
MKPILSMLNIFIDPQEAVKGFDSKWAWVWPLLIVSIVTGIVGWLTIPLAIQAMQYEPPRGLTQEQLQAAMPRIQLISRIGVYTIPITTGLMMVLWAGILAGTCAVMDIKASFHSLFTLVAHCSLINAVQAAANYFVLNLKRDDIQSIQQLVPHFGLDLLLGDGANKQLVALLGYFSIFQIWYLVILALGLGFLAGVPKGKAFAAITPVWILGLMMRIGSSFFG